MLSGMYIQARQTTAGRPLCSRMTHEHPWLQWERDLSRYPTPSDWPTVKVMCRAGPDLLHSYADVVTHIRGRRLVIGPAQHISRDGSGQSGRDSQIAGINAL